VLNFAILAGAIIVGARKPVSRYFNDRIQGIRDQLGDLEKRKKVAGDALAENEQKLKSLQDETEKIVGEYIRQGNEAKDRILKEAESAAVKLEEQAKRNIEQEFAQARTKLKAEVLEKALIKAEQMIKSGITDNDQEKIVDEYLQKVVA